MRPPSPPAPKPSRAVPRPKIAPLPAKSAPGGQRLELSLSIVPATAAPYYVVAVSGGER
jgi:hypothetical protein